MRIVLAALALFAAWMTPAAAQETPAPAVSEPPAAEHPTTVALRDFFLATFIETGLVDATIEHFQPIYRQTITGWEVYRRANPQRRAALDAIIEGIPDMMREEITAEAGVMAANTTTDVQRLVSPEEMASILELMRLPLWRRHALSAFETAVASKGEGEAEINLSEDDLAQIAALENTPGAQALMRVGDQFWSLLNAERDAAFARLTPRMQERLGREFCEALGRDCPRELRQHLRET